MSIQNGEYETPDATMKNDIDEKDKNSDKKFIDPSNEQSKNVATVSEFNYEKEIEKINKIKNSSLIIESETIDVKCDKSEEIVYPYVQTLVLISKINVILLAILMICILFLIVIPSLSMIALFNNDEFEKLRYLIYLIFFWNVIDILSIGFSFLSIHFDWNKYNLLMLITNCINNSFYICYIILRINQIIETSFRNHVFSFSLSGNTIEISVIFILTRIVEFFAFAKVITFLFYILIQFYNYYIVKRAAAISGHDKALKSDIGKKNNSK